MKIKSIISIILVLALALSTTISAQSMDEKKKSDWIKNIDEKGKTSYHNKKTDETIVQAFRYNDDGDLIEASLEEAMPYILESMEEAKKSKKEDKKDIAEEEVSTSTSLYITWDYDETYSGSVWGATEKVTADAHGPTNIQYATSVSFSDSYSVDISISGTIKKVIQTGASFDWSTSSSSGSSLGLGYDVPAGSYGAVYFAPYYNYTRGTLTKEVRSYASGSVSTSTWYNQSAKSPKTLGNGLADGYYYLVLNN